MKVAVLAGGVGGARFVRALLTSAPETSVTVVANVGDDLEVHGLHVSPDLDTLLYTLSGLADDARGWGRADETWNARETLELLGEETWFQLGDRDLGLHLARTDALARGEPLSAITRRFAEALALPVTLLPATDERLRTKVVTPLGELEFQDWFVRRGHRDPVTGIRFDGAAEARPAPGVVEAIESADAILIAPSNPFVSIDPIVAVARIRDALVRRSAPSIAVSPLIGGRAVKGPAQAMFERLAGGTSAADVARCYAGLIDALAFDEADADDAEAVAELRIEPIVTRTLLSDPDVPRDLVPRLLAVAGAAA